MQTRAELDEYLRQAESEGRAEELYGKGVQLITPEAAFVIRFLEAGSGAKVFVNLCTSAKVCCKAQVVFLVLGVSKCTTSVTDDALHRTGHYKWQGHIYGKG